MKPQVKQIYRFKHLILRCDKALDNIAVFQMLNDDLTECKSSSPTVRILSEDRLNELTVYKV